jgi:glutamate-1-semialdehyde 2,1-aminomutase
MSRNAELFERACRSIPGGVNSPVRAFRSVGGTPRFVARAQGPYFWDAEDKRYIDYIGSWGPAILGHAHPEVVKAVQDAAVHGLSYGAPTEAEIEIAEMLIARMPSFEQVRLVSSGTEATMTAIRLARGATGRNKIIKFEGCYHGHADSLLVKAGSGLLTAGGDPTSAGVPPEFVAHTIVLDYNDIAGVKAAFAAHGKEIACIIVEPIAGNMNMIKPIAGFLETLRSECTAHGALLIFDEVMTGFRVGPQGVQGLTGGTLSGNPVAVAAGITTLKLLSKPGFYEDLAARTRKLTEGLTAAARKHGIAFCADSEGGMFGMYFSNTVPTTLAEVSASNIDMFKVFFHAMLDEGVYFAPSAYEAGFVSSTHNDEVIAATVAAADRVFAKLV